MLKRIISISLIICLLGVVAYGIKKVYFSLTDGFSIANITSNHTFNPAWEPQALTQDEYSVVEKALGQTYTYLGKGHQAYVFESADHQFVIKFLKFQKYTIGSWFETVPLPGFLSDWRQKKIRHKDHKRDALFRSWMIAFNDLKGQTGVLMIHINETKDLNKTIAIVDKMGRHFDIKLDDHVFLLQRKADMLATVIEGYVAKGQNQNAQEILDKLLEMYLMEYRRGVEEKDRYIVRNTGILDGRPIHIDMGRFIRDNNLKKPEVYTKELVWKTTLLKAWLEKYYPQLSLYFNQRLEQLSTPP